MSSRKDIIDGSNAETARRGLVYTRKCGWIDLVHAQPGAASVLWSRMTNDVGRETVRSGYYELTFRMVTGKLGRLETSIQSQFAIRKKLSVSQRRSVALAIYIGTSHAAESAQASFPINIIVDSGYSAEDMFSNLLSFYRALFPASGWIARCEPVSRDEALNVWDTYGAVGSIKNMRPGPILFPVAGSDLKGPICAQIPDFLNTIHAAQEGELFFTLRGRLRGRK